MPTFYQDKLQILMEKDKQGDKNIALATIQDENEVAVVSDVELTDGVGKGMEHKDKIEIQEKGQEGMEQSATTTATANDVTITAADKSKALAQSRLLLNETISSLAQICKDESKKDRKYSGIQIEMSTNQKIWKMDSSKNGEHILREDVKNFGTATKKYGSAQEDSEDFIKFVQEKRRKEEDLATRPKPPPGGVVGNVAASRENAENAGEEEPVAAIVLHLREKEAEAKKARKKQEKDKKKVKSVVGSSDKVDSAKKTSGNEKKSDSVVHRKRSKGKKNKTKKDNKSGVKNDVKAPPKVLRK